MGESYSNQNLGEQIMEALLYEDLTYLIRHGIFEVHNEIGVGYDEETYHQGLKRIFARDRISFVSKQRFQLKHRGVLVREFELDYIIEDRIILALKCLPCDFLQINFIQLFTELKLWQKHLGLLANFGLPKVKIERRIYHEKPLVIDENYEYIEGLKTKADWQIVGKVRDAIHFVGVTHGLGFGRPVVQKLIETEFLHQQIKSERDVPISVNYLGETIRIFKMRHLLIDGSVICGITALQDSITYYDISKIKSYLRALNLSTGIAINFGKSKLEIRGVRGD
jgi:GxxExxY protein